MDLFVVTEGEYSSYTILGIFSTKEKAERAKDLLAEDNDIEEWTLDDIPETPPGMRRYVVEMDRNGNTNSVRHVSILGSDHWTPCFDYVHVSFKVLATDENHAVKIANEKRIGLLASNQWTTDWKEWKEAFDRNNHGRKTQAA